MKFLSHRQKSLRKLAIGLVGITLFQQTSTAQNEPETAAKKKIFVQQMQAGKLSCSLDPLVKIPEVWALLPTALDSAYAIPDGMKVAKNPYFQWLTESHERAVFSKQPFSNVKLEMSLFGGELPADEVIVDFIENKLNGITITLYNKGDSGKIETQEFQRRLKLCGQKIGELLQSSPVLKKANPTQGLLAEGWFWSSPRGMASLEYNPDAMQGDAEFLRLRLAPRDAKGLIAASLQGRSVTVKASDLPKNVSKESNGNVVINGLPMVDQGQKGYCLVATTQRLFEYYGIPADQHQIAQAAGTSASEGTSTLAMAEALGKIDYRFKTRFKILAMRDENQLVEVNERKMTVGKHFEQTAFIKEVRRYIAEGVPLLWSLELGRYPEEPPISKQTAGGHMRMIIGYNDKTGHILFSDSWGAGHELKKMKLDDAYSASTGLFVMLPTVR
ncbi:MAG: C39 family peptidase [Gloeobacteraceae cyanobacterium ES-bin-144]|nr:C39 family peptidase [Verrucomicrobiales bacterium]